MSEELELKPCPFCGRKKSKLHFESFCDGVRVVCIKCGLKGSTGRDKNEAMTLWNKALSRKFEYKMFPGFGRT